MAYCQNAARGQTESRAVSTVAGQGTVAVFKSSRQWPMERSGEGKEDSRLLNHRFTVGASAVVSHSNRQILSLRLQ